MGDGFSLRINSITEFLGKICKVADKLHMDNTQFVRVKVKERCIIQLRSLSAMMSIEAQRKLLSPSCVNLSSGAFKHS
jgi:hypothetical protein